MSNLQFKPPQFKKNFISASDIYLQDLLGKQFPSFSDLLYMTHVTREIVSNRIEFLAREKFARMENLPSDRTIAILENNTP